MSNNINWGKIYESTAWGSGVTDNNISWGKAYADLAGGGGFTGLLDTYSGAAAAYSLRQLSSAYSGSAIKVRRSSDNAEQDIAFVNNELDTASLETFAGAGDAFVTTWYDQSGNGRNATQATASSQPKIVSSGSTILDGGKAAVQFDGTDDHIDTGTQIGLANTGSIYAVSSIDNTSNFRAHFANSYADDIWVGAVLNTTRLQIWTNNQNSDGGSGVFTLNTPFLASYFMKSGTNGHKIYVNNSIYLTSSETFTIPNPTTTNGAIGRDEEKADYEFSGKMQEILFFADNTDTNNSGINTNINDFYSIY